MFKMIFAITSVFYVFSAYALTCSEVQSSCNSGAGQEFRRAEGVEECICYSFDPRGTGFVPVAYIGDWTQEKIKTAHESVAGATPIQLREEPLVEGAQPEGTRRFSSDDFRAFQQACQTESGLSSNGEAVSDLAISQRNAARDSYYACLRRQCPSNYGNSQECISYTNSLVESERVAFNDTNRAPGGRVPGASDTSGSSGDSNKLPITSALEAVTASQIPTLKRTEKFNFSSTPNVKNSYGYSDRHIFCEAELAGNSNWERALGKDSGWWDASMEEFVVRAKSEFYEKAKDGGISAIDFVSWYESKIAEIRNRTETYQTCTAIIYSLKGRVDLSDSSTTEGVGRGGKYEVASATKPDLKCVTYMYETVDFKACKAALNAFDGAFIAEQGMGVYQNYDFQSKNMDRQSDLNKKQLQGGTIDTTDALAMQKGAVKDQASVANQRAAFSAAKVGLLATMLSKMPSSNDVKNSCEGGSTKAAAAIDTWKSRVSEFKAWIDGIQTTEGALFSVAPSRIGKSLAIAEVSTSNTEYVAGCNSVQGVTGQGSSSDWTVQLIRNQDIKTKIKAEMIKAGVDMAGNIAKAALLNKQAGEIDDVINSINKFEPPPLPENQMTDMQILECQANPQAENCGTINGRGNVGFSSNGINVGNGQFATSDGQGIDLGNSDGTSANSATSKSDRTGMARKLGGATADAAADAGILNPVSAAEVKKGGGNPGGGGGGAGAAAPGAAAGGGGGGKPGTSASGAGGQGLAKMKYSGSSTGSLSWSGGGGLARKPAAKVDNPFANLLGKGGSKNGVLDGFRGPASGIGKKEDGLFNMISNRYSQVANDKERLIQYEIKK